MAKKVRTERGVKLHLYRYRRDHATRAAHAAGFRLEAAMHRVKVAPEIALTAA